MRTAVALRLHEQELKERELERQKRAQEMIKLREQIEVEERKMEQFNQWIESWEKAERLRRFIAAYAEKTSKWASLHRKHSSNDRRSRIYGRNSGTVHRQVRKRFQSE
jgi:hypothetical protein